MIEVKILTSFSCKVLSDLIAEAKNDKWRRVGNLVINNEYDKNHPDRILGKPYYYQQMQRDSPFTF